jgi:predicted transcriptional regulator
MRDMKNKSTMLSVRLDADLLTDLNDLARRLGDDNTSAAARLAIRWGLIHGPQLTQPKAQSETQSEQPAEA